MTGVIAVASLALAAPAAATDRFASPTGDDMGATNTCTSSMTPCTIERAVEVVAVAGDDVSLAGGTYTLTNTLQMPGTDPDITVHGSPGARPTILFTTALSQGVSVSGILRDVNVEDSATVAELIQLSEPTDLAERVFVHATGGRACEVAGLIRDSVCWTEAVATAGLRTSAGPSSTATGMLRNVTALGTGVSGYGVQAMAGGMMSRAEIFASNVIAQGAMFDVQADNGGLIASVTLDHSNYAIRSEVGGGTVTDPATSSNQMTPPVFVDAANGDFRQTAASAGTLDLGTAGATSLGALDLDGDPRIVGSAPDIGADELVPPSNPAPPGQPAATPAVLPSPKPTCKKKKKKRKKGKRKKRRCRR